MKTKKLIVIYPYKFSDFLWKLLELEELSKYVEVIVWDVSKISSPRFSSQIVGKLTPRDQIIRLESIVSFNSELKNLLSENNEEDICILNEIPQGNYRDFILNAFLSFKLQGKEVKVFDLYNGGVLIHSAGPVDEFGRKSIMQRFISVVKLSSSLKEFLRKFSSYTFNKLGEFFRKPLTHRLVAGEVWKSEAKRGVSQGVRIIEGHSHDYSTYLREVHSRNRSESIGLATLLDGAGPYFKSDALLTGRKVYFTSEVWYPALSNFFEFLESDRQLTVRVAGHYKTNFDSPSLLFGNREVVYGRTPELVASSKFVITRISTAISFAVLYKKPIIFIYSDQLLKDSEFMSQIISISNVLGTSPINIDHFPTNLESYLRVNEDKYKRYTLDFLTSKPNGVPNYRIILQDIMGVKVAN
jgi:hypothetical protein